MSEIDIYQLKKPGDDNLYNFRDGIIEPLVDLTSTESAYANPLTLTTLEAQTAKSTKIKLEPIQDLHGQDKPYPAGGGKNKFDQTSLLDQTTWAVITLTLKTNTAYTISSNLPANNNVVLLYGLGESNIKVYSGHPATITTDSAGELNIQYRLADTTDSFQNYNWQVEEGNQATSYAPYSNECPISGYDKINILGCGKNILNPIVFANSSTYFTVNDDGTVTQLLNDGRTESSMTTLPLNAGTYIVSRGTTSGTMTIYGNMDGTWINFVNNSSAENAQFTLPKKCNTYVKLSINGSYPLTLYPMIRPVSFTDATFEPYNKITDLSYELSETVYGGELDVESGVLTVDRAIVDLGNLSYVYNTENYYFYTTDISNRKYSSTIRCISSIYEDVGDKSATEMLNVPHGKMASNNNNITIKFKNTSYTDTSTFKTAMTGQKIVYELATPFTIQLTPHLVNLLKGYNYLSTNCTGIKVIFRNGAFATLEELSKHGVVDLNYVHTDNNYTNEEKAKLAAIDTLEVSLDLTNHAIVITQNI